MSKQGLGIKMYFRKYLLGFGGKNGQRYLGMDKIPLAPFPCVLSQCFIHLFWGIIVVKVDFKSHSAMLNVKINHPCFLQDHHGYRHQDCNNCSLHPHRLYSPCHHHPGHRAHQDYCLTGRY